MAIKIYRKDAAPVALTFTLPGLRVENNSRDPGQPPTVLTLGVLTNWLRDTAQLDVTQPQVQEEARELMELFEPYYDTAPPPWQQLTSSSVAGLRSFDLGGYASPLIQYGAFGPLFFGLMGIPGGCLCVFYLLALPAFKRTFAEARTEIVAGRWVPPENTNASTQVAKPVASVALQPRFSRMALTGAAFLILFVGVAVNFLVFNLSEKPRGHWEGTQPPQFNQNGNPINKFVPVSLMSQTVWRVAVAASAMLAILSILGITICGWVAVSQIRRSSGNLSGLPLAVFDGLFFPVLAIDYLIAAAIFFGVQAIIPKESFGGDREAIGGVCSLLGMSVLDYFIVRNVWRFCRQ